MKKYLIILVCVLLCGCVSTRKVRNQSLEVAKFDIEKFNGNYVNKPDKAEDFNANKLLFEQLFSDEFSEKNNPITENTIINIYLTDNNKALIIKAIENGKILCKMKLKGRIKENYFSIKRKLFILPIPPLLYSHQETKILLGNDKNGNLIVKDGFYNTIFILVIGGNDGISQSQFKKIK